MTAVVIAMLLCVAAGLVVVGYVTVEARRDGRQIWTPEGEEMIAQARRQGEQLVERGEQLGRRTTSGVRRPRRGRGQAPEGPADGDHEHNDQEHGHQGGSHQRDSGESRVAS